MKNKEYKYPVGDFLSGFSDDNSNPCDYELECQRMVIRGVQYLDKNPELFEQIRWAKLKVSDTALVPMIQYMCSNEERKECDEAFGQTGAMVNHSVNHAYNAKKLGWDNYIKKITNQ
jgi:hypothetical protein